MAKLINGNGNPAIYASQDADLIASLSGNTTSIAAVGNEFAATQEDANTIGLADGVIITQEGRRIQLDDGDTDLFTIPTGTAGTTSYYIIGYKLVTALDSSQSCETFVQKMNSSSETITEETFKSGASEVYVSCYRVTQDGLNIDSIDLLLPKLGNITGLKADLSAKANLSLLQANSKTAQLTYSNGKYGFTINGTFYELGGGGMPFLNYTNPLHSFSSNDDTWTATKDCYIVGTFVLTSSAYLSIDGKRIGGGGATVGGSNIIVPLKQGQIAKLHGTRNSAYDFLYACEPI